MREYYKLVAEGGAEDKFQAARNDTRQSLERLRTEIDTNQEKESSPEQPGESISQVTEFAGHYEELNRLCQSALELAKSNQQDKAFNLIETKIEPLLEDSLQITVEQLEAKKRLELDEQLAVLSGHSDDLITPSHDDLQASIKNMKGHIIDTFLVLTVARNFNRQMHEYYFLVLTKNSDANRINSAHRTTFEALENWKINEGGGVGQRATASKDLEDVENVENELNKIDQLDDPLPELAGKGETIQALHLLTNEIEPIADGQLADILEESVRHEGKALAESLANVNTSSDRLQLGLGVFSMFVLIIGLGTPWLLSRTIISPILQLRSAASKVGSGNLETRVPVTSAGELSQLATSFNQMTEALKASRESLYEANRELERKVADRTVELKNSNEQLQSELVEREKRIAAIIQSSLAEKEVSQRSSSSR